MTHIRKGFSLRPDEFAKLQNTIDECRKLRNAPIKAKQDEAMALIEDSNLDIDVRKRHLFTEKDILFESMKIYLKHLEDNASTMPTKKYAMYDDN